MPVCGSVIEGAVGDAQVHRPLVKFGRPVPRHVFCGYGKSVISGRQVDQVKGRPACRRRTTVENAGYHCPRLHRLQPEERLRGIGRKRERWLRTTLERQIGWPLVGTCVGYRDPSGIEVRGARGLQPKKDHTVVVLGGDGHVLEAPPVSTDVETLTDSATFLRR